ncbi:Major Facilitator Superfamily protein [Actinokineospora alba]|uniref:Major Facilitator Superfamily protein n=1 Tax=Actinokineospora alba TaxID=504798 RepID=A0A1H0FZP1_9PSEU|nr:MFS transporter [Actinokineospora alba]TDP69697.1 MFS transporter [Actinokineospora alba]SDI10807.1 Major Facilitator Superfamily protein [Actinokineospora alba]SDO00115.1 Major Facilitator Superfamily protein [Actinokineospora alba]
MALTEAPAKPGPVARLLPETPPQRALAVASFVNALGSGMFMAGSALYFTRIVGLPMAQVALGLFIGAMVGLVAGVLAGRIADRFGARETQIVVMVAGAAAMTCYMFVTTLGPYILVSILVGLVFAADKSSKAPLIRGFGGDNPAKFRAYLRSVVNLALALGSLAAGIAIQLDTESAYLALIGGRVLAFVGGAIMLTRLPRLAPVAAPVVVGRWEALRDRPYLTATVLNSMMSLHFAVPTFLMPLWIVDHTAAPRWMVSVALALNTVMVITLQVVVSRNVSDHVTAGRRMRWAGLAVAVGMVIMAAAGDQPAGIAIALLLASMAVYTIGELWHSAASMEYSFGLAAPHAQGQYSGVFGLGGGVAEALAPAVLGLALTYGTPAWLAIAAGFLLVGAACKPLVDWSLHRWRPAHL